MSQLLFQTCLAFVLLFGFTANAKAAIVYSNLGSFGGETYRIGVSTEGPLLTWDAANADAISNGYQLASIGSAGENSYLFSQVVGVAQYWGGSAALANQLGPWLGGYSDYGSATSWNWVDNSQLSEPFATFGPATWQPGQPDNAEFGSGYTNGLLFFNATSLGSTGTPDNWGDYGLNAGLGAPVAFIVETTLSPVPEPASLLAWSGIGIAGLIAGYRRMRKQTV